MAIASLDAAAAVQDVASTTYTVSAGSNRLLVVCSYYAFSGSPAPAITAMTYGTVAMTLAKAQVNSPTALSSVEIWYLLEAGIAAASTTTLARTYDTEPSIDGLTLASYTGVDQIGGSTTNPVNAGAFTDGTTPNPLILDLSEVDNGLVFSSVSSHSGACAWGGDMAEISDDNVSGLNFSSANRFSTTDANVDIEPLLTSQIGRSAGASCVFAPAAVAPANLLPASFSQSMVRF